MEGISSIVSKEETFHGKPMHAAACRAMVKDVNAAIQGAIEGGATEIVVNDCHFKGLNIDPEELDPRARLIRGQPSPMMIAGLDRSFHALFLVGYHAKKGTPLAILDHTDTGQYTSVRINGKEIGEIGLSMLVGKSLGVPTLFISGDKASIAEARACVPGVTGVVTKEAMGRESGNCLSPEIVRDKILSGCTRALVNAKKKIRYNMPRAPFTLDMEFVYTAVVDRISAMPGITRTGGRAIRFKSRNILEIANLLSMAANFL
jgi:D-amino peptidase